MRSGVRYDSATTVNQPASRRAFLSEHGQKRAIRRGYNNLHHVVRVSRLAASGSHQLAENNMKKIQLVIAALAVAFGLAACDKKEQPAEQATQAAEQAAEAARSAASQAAEAASDAANEAAEGAGDAAAAASDAASDAADAAVDAAEKAADAAQEAAESAKQEAGQ